MAEIEQETGVAHRWAQRLGLALSDLFGRYDKPFGVGSHFALLDGVTASFSLSVADDPPAPQIASAYAWSSNLRKHVLFDSINQRVRVVTVSRPGNVDQYSVAEVEGRLDQFLEYLTADRQIPKATVVERLLAMLDQYRQIAAAEYRDQKERDTAAMYALLLDIGLRSETGKDAEAVSTKYELPMDRMHVSSRLIDRAKGAATTWLTSEVAHDLHAALSVRHAGGAIFQRVTAELSVLPQIELFTGLQGVERGRPQSLRLGGYFTPPGLARSLAEAAITGKTTKDALRICDPACGSAVFLAEVLRALQRVQYSGTVHLVGRDISPTAIEIAKFVTRSAALDFDEKRVTIDIAVGNSLTDDFGSGFDIALQNPPFRAWEQSNAIEREQIRAAMGESFAGKPDLSLAFANLSLGKLTSDGVLATLLPIGVLSAEYSKPWREKLGRNAQVSLVGTLGDHYIFDYALVNVAALVARRGDAIVPSAQKTLMLWASQDSRASSVALRALRKQAYSPNEGGDMETTWRTYSVSQAELIRRSSWAPAAFGREELIAELRSRGCPNLGDLFHVHQGIRTGSREAFILSQSDYDDLPSAEKPGFRLVCEKDGINKFQIRKDSYIFYSASLREPIKSEADFKKRFKTYYERFIEPNQVVLRARPRGVKLWELSWGRSWLKKPEPKVVSRMFLGKRQYGFAVDETGALAVVQGYGWVPVWKEISGRTNADDRLAILHGYAFLFSSEMFYDMVRTVSVNIAGGQFDLAPKYIDTLPIPDWSYIKSAVGPRLDTLDAARQLAESFSKDANELEAFARAAFGVKA